MAAPFVAGDGLIYVPNRMTAVTSAGIAALYLQNHPNATPGQVYDAIKAGFTRTPTIVTKEKSSRKFISPPLMCYINGLETCQDPVDCQVMLLETIDV